MADLTGIDKLRQLARRLASATRDGRINWSAESNLGEFEHSTSRATVVIRSVDNDGVHPFVLEVYDGSGSRVDSLSTGEVTAARDDVEALYHAARRQVGKVDEVLDALLEDLPPDPAAPPF